MARASTGNGRGVRDIVVIGASAGGIEVLLRLVRDLPRDLPASIFIVVHQGPRAGYLAEMLGRNGALPTLNGTNKHRFAAGHIYVAPANYHMTLKNRHIHLTVGPTVNRHRPAIDLLFESAAQGYGKRVIGVVLSGHFDDGTAGLAAIKQHGGIAVVQDPEEAYAPDMPRNAARHVKVDYCLPAAEIAPLLVKVVTGRNNNHRK